MCSIGFDITDTDNYLPVYKYTLQIENKQEKSKISFNNIAMIERVFCMFKENYFYRIVRIFWKMLNKKTIGGLFYNKANKHTLKGHLYFILID